MKKSFIFLTSAFAALAFAGCAADATDDIKPAQQGAIRTVGADIEELTRTSMTDFEAGAIGRLVWSENDAIGLVTSDGTIRKAVIRAEYVGQPYAEFDVEGAVEGETYDFAYYPYAYYGASATTAGVSGNTLSLTLPQKQRFVFEGAALVEGQTFQTRMNTMAAKPDEKGTMHFRSLCGIIEVRMTAASASSLFNVTLQSDNSKLAGAATVDMSADEPTLVMANTTKAFHTTYMQGADIANKGIKLNAANPTSLYFTVPVGVYDDLRIATSTIGGGKSIGAQRVSTRPHTVKPNTILALPAYDIETVDAELYGEGMYTDLSVDAEGNPAYSNCYLVQPSDTPKAYRIRACFNDGTNKMLKYPDGTPVATDDLANQNLAFCAWESEEGMVSHVRRDGDYIYFTLSGKAGNAYIQTASTGLAALIGWHIWVSDVKEQTLPGGHVFMDRNLGATYSPASKAEADAMTDEQIAGSAGMLYQWGNPHPEEGENLDHLKNTKKGWADNSLVLHKWVNTEYGQKWTASASTAAGLLNAFQFTNYFYGQNGWWANGKEEVYGANALWQSKKTMFDPCPIGYRVASRTEFGQAFTNSIGAPYNGKKYTFHQDAQGSYITLNDNFVFIPWAGFRINGNSTSTRGTITNIYKTGYPRVHYWFFDEEYTTETLKDKTILYGYSGGGGDIKSGFTDEMDSKSYGFFYLTAGTAGTTTADTTAGKANLYLFDGRAFIANGFSLRCVKIQNASTAE